MKKSKILIAAGGTGGHLFPAQTLSDQLLKEHPDLELFFAGAKLSSNAYFDQKKFRFYDIASTTPFRGGPLAVLKSIGVLINGIKESVHLLSKEKPMLIVGFGSFHVFPILFAAVIKKIPIVLFESNAIPGKVVRLFSKKAQWTGIYFSAAKDYLKGATHEVEIPTRVETNLCISKQEARRRFGLNPDTPTLLIFGGSQGAQEINNKILQMLSLLKNEKLSFQLIHLTGCDAMAMRVEQCCNELGITCYAKKFEKRMEVAWEAADIVVCRSGAMTLAELLFHEVPGVLIPYPFASDQHQLKNALFIEKNVGGSMHLLESALTPELLTKTVKELIEPHSSRAKGMKKAIQNYKSQQKKQDLSRLILELL